MAIDTQRDRKRAFDYGLPYANFPFPKDEIDEESRAHIWGSYIVGFNPVPDSPYYIGDHTVRTLALLIEQFKPATLLKGFISAFTNSLQETEDTAADLMTRRLISTSIGVQLDGVGSIVGETRQGRNDDVLGHAAVVEEAPISPSALRSTTTIATLSTREFLSTHRTPNRKP